MLCFCSIFMYWFICCIVWCAPSFVGAELAKHLSDSFNKHSSRNRSRSRENCFCQICLPFQRREYMIPRYLYAFHLLKIFIWLPNQERRREKENERQGGRDSEVRGRMWERKQSNENKCYYYVFHFCYHFGMCGFMICCVFSSHLFPKKIACVIFYYYDVCRMECNIVISLTILVRYIEISLHFEEFNYISDFCQMALIFLRLLAFLPICIDL